MCDSHYLEMEMVVKSKVIYPLFEKLALSTYSDQARDILDRFSKGKFIPEIRYDGQKYTVKQTICKSYNFAEMSEAEQNRVVVDSIERIFNLTDIMVEKSSSSAYSSAVTSTRSGVNKATRVSRDNVFNTQTNAKKTFLINHFAESKTDDQHIVDQIVATVNLGILLQKIVPGSDIQMEGNRIVSIDGIILLPTGHAKLANAEQKRAMSSILSSK